MEMGFTLQGAGPFLHWLTLGILFAMPVLIGLIVYKLGSLPGNIASARNHPQAKAISICGWMGVITLIMWPIAMVWAYLNAAAGRAAEGSSSEASSQSLVGKLQQASQRLAEIEASLSKTTVRGA
jgi:Protein of unknown function (DUF3302)